MTHFIGRLRLLLLLVPLGFFLHFCCINIPFEWCFTTQLIRVDDTHFFTSIDSDSDETFIVFDTRNRTWRTADNRASLLPSFNSMDFSSLPLSSSSRVVPHNALPFALHESISSSTNGKSIVPDSICELYRVGEDNQIEMIASWPTLANGLASFEKNEVVNLDPSGTSIEIRSLANGDLQKSVELEVPIDLSMCQAEISSGLIVVRSAVDSKYFSIEDGKLITNPFPSVSDPRNLSVELSPDRRHALWWQWGGDEAIVTNARTDAVIKRVTDDAQYYRLLNNTTLISINCDLGITVRGYDLNSAGNDFTWRPFWWVLPLQTVALVATVIWTWKWLSLPRLGTSWIWFDVSAVFIVLMTLIVCRLTSVGDKFDVSRLPHEFATELSVAYLLAAWSWLILAVRPIIFRLAVLLISYTIVLGTFGCIFGESSELVWARVCEHSVPSIMLIPILITMRIIGVRLREQSDGERRSKDHITIVQLLFLMVAFAFLFAVSRSFPIQFSVAATVGASLVPAVFAALFGLLGLLIGFCSHAFGRRTLYVLLLLGTVLAFEGLLHCDFTHSLNTPEWLYVGRNLLHLHCVILLSTFLCAYTMHTTGLRLTTSRKTAS